MINFLHNFLPQPILFQFGLIKIYWYGLFMVLGIIAGLTVVLKLAKRLSIKNDEVYDLGFYLIIFSLIGARIYAVFLELPFYLKNPFEIIAVWHGGLAIHGAIIGGVLTLIIYSWKKKQSFWQWADLLAPALALGQTIGRFGNYFNQEIFGKPTDLPWGIPIALQNRPIDYISQQYFHPTFLYESGLNLINFFILFFLLKLKNSSKLQVTSLPRKIAKRFIWGYRLQEGAIALVYLINYSLIRIAMEFLRTDHTPKIFGIRLPILVSLGIIILSLGLIISRHKSLKSKTRTV